MCLQVNGNRLLRRHVSSVMLMEKKGGPKSVPTGPSKISMDAYRLSPDEAEIINCQYY